MKRARPFIYAFILLSLVLTLNGCKSRSYTTEKALVDMAKQYVDLYSQKRFSEIIPLLSGEHLAAMRKALPVLDATGGAIETKISNWEGKCDFINRTKDRASVIASYMQQQTIKGVGTATDQFTVVYEFTKINNEWKIYSVKISNKTPVK